MRQENCVLITGGYGYLGGRLAQYLSKSGYQVVIGSRKQNSSPDWLTKSDVVQLIWEDEDALVEACKGINIVIHAAGMNAQDCIADPVAALEFNGLATAKLVRASRKAGVSHFIYLSTVHVYGSPLVGEIDENTCPRNSHPYATSHLAGEQAVLFRSKSASDFHGTVLRLSNVIGAPVHADVNCWMLLVNDLCRQAVKHQKIILRSTGMQRRNFISMTDVCRAIKFLLESTLLEGDNEIYNVCGMNCKSVLKMAQYIAERFHLLTGKMAEIDYQENTSQLPSEVFRCNTRKLSNLGFNLLGRQEMDQEVDGLINFCIEHEENKL